MHLCPNCHGILYQQELTWLRDGPAPSFMECDDCQKQFYLWINILGLARPLLFEKYRYEEALNEYGGHSEEFLGEIVEAQHQTRH